MKNTPHRTYFVIEAWCVGALVGALVWGATHAPWLSSRLEIVDALLLLVPFLTLTALSALGASTRRAGALEVGAVLTLAFFPLGLAELASWWQPGDYAPARCACEQHLLPQIAFDELFLVAEVTALACLTVGAVGLAARRPSALRLIAVPFSVLAGAGIGGRIAGAPGVVLGVTMALTAAVIVVTARDVRSNDQPTREATKGARMLAVLALALAGSVAAQAHLGSLMAPFAIGDLDTHAEAVVMAHRALSVGLLGCGALFGYALWAGRLTSISGESARVVFLGVLLCLGAATHLRCLRVDAVNTTLAYYEEGRLERAFAASGPTDLEPGPLPWPLRGERRALPRIEEHRVHLILPASECPTVEIEAGETRIEPEDGATYGEVLRALNETSP
ncbi:MAG: hypothetical protein AB8I08_14715 [Sandaracinaceae bacterium]